MASGNPSWGGFKRFTRICQVVLSIMVFSFPLSFLRGVFTRAPHPPSSPSLFIIVLELLAVSIRNNDQIKGITVGSCEIKLVIFADDMTSFVRDKLSYHTLFETIYLFGTYSGLKVNHDKTEILLLGNMNVSCSELDVDEISKVIKILGVYFTFNHSLFYKLNFESFDKSLRG